MPVSAASSRKIAIVGNPNAGKTTLFNALTGLNQRTGNFPGVTVDKKTGHIPLAANSSPLRDLELVDLPGIYSLYPKSLDEKVALEVLCDRANPDHPDVTLIVVDASNLKRNLFLVTQILDLKMPAVVALTMLDVAQKKGDKVDLQLLQQQLGVPVIGVNARKKDGLDKLKQALSDIPHVSKHTFINSIGLQTNVLEEIKELANVTSNYAAFQVANNLKHLSYLTIQPETLQRLQNLLQLAKFNPVNAQALESVGRYRIINELFNASVCKADQLETKKNVVAKIDSLLTHRFWGYAIFLLILFAVFQSIFTLAQYPMDAIESLFIWINQQLEAVLPPGLFTNLLLNGILAGLSGVAIFIPQIALLFLFICVLEDTGYMARVSFIMDKLMRRFGLNGRSVIPLISGVACAVPAIMSARTIGNTKERLITILVTPLMSCSARLPVYTLLISLVIPSTKIAGILNLQGLVLMGLYLIGFVAAMGVSLLFKWVLKSKERSYFIMELPIYRTPNWKSVGLTIFEKVKVFLMDAGKVIVAISVILWALSSYGPNMSEVVRVYDAKMEAQPQNRALLQQQKATAQLEASYAGRMGKWLEPAIAPLGFDWKIGISLITSFAAREVFVGTMATIYSAGSEENEKGILAKMHSATNLQTGEKIYTPAVGVSLMLFYAFALQCMSTLAVVRRETGSWKWPLLQFMYMGVLAYLSSLAAFTLLQ